MPDVQTLNAGNLYPGDGFISLGLEVTGGSAYAEPVGQETNPAPTPGPGSQTMSLGGWVVLLVMLLALMFVARKFGGDSGFSNIKLSAYNVLVIGWAAIVGLVFWKAVVTMVPAPTPLKAVVYAA